jgi:hypothetical protein
MLSLSPDITGTAWVSRRSRSRIWASTSQSLKKIWRTFGLHSLDSRSLPRAPTQDDFRLDDTAGTSAGDKAALSLAEDHSTEGLPDDACPSNAHRSLLKLR